MEPKGKHHEQCRRLPSGLEGAPVYTLTSSVRVPASSRARQLSELSIFLALASQIVFK